MNKKEYVIIILIRIKHQNVKSTFSNAENISYNDYVIYLFKYC